MSKKGMKRPGSNEVAKNNKGVKHSKNEVYNIPQADRGSNAKSVPGMCNCKGLDGSKSCGGGCGK